MVSWQISQVLLGQGAATEGSSCFRVGPLLARFARSPGVFRPAAVLGSCWASCGLLGLIWGFLGLIFDVPGPPGAHLKPPFSPLGGSRGRLAASWALPIWGSPGVPLGIFWASWGLPRPPREPRQQEKAPQIAKKHQKYRKIRGFVQKISVFARFGCIFDPKNAAKSSENVVFGAETSYFTMPQGPITLSR